MWKVPFLPGNEKMKLYFAGGDNTHWAKMLTAAGVERVLKSAYGMNFRRDLYPFPDVLYDSGGFSARTRNVKIDVNDYIKFLNENKVKLAFNLDTNDLDESWKNQALLEKETSAYILPIYHWSEHRKKEHRGILEMMIEKYPFISIGGVAKVIRDNKTRRAYLSYIFKRARDKVRVHGLGITAIGMLFEYPFYSVDSTSWESWSRYGQIQKLQGLKIKNFRSALKTKRPIEALEQLQKPNEYKAIEEYLKIEKYATELWEQRGINWNAYDQKNKISRLSIC